MTLIPLEGFVVISPLSQTMWKAWVGIWYGFCEPLRCGTSTEIGGEALNSLLGALPWFSFDIQKRNDKISRFFSLFRSVCSLLNELFQAQGDPVFWHHSSFRHSSTLWTERPKQFAALESPGSTTALAAEHFISAQLLNPFLTTHLVQQPWVDCPWLCKKACTKERAVPCCVAPGQPTLQHETKFLIQYYFSLCYISLIKSKPLSLLDAFVIASSLASAYTAGFSLHLKCRKFKHYV